MSKINNTFTDNVENLNIVMVMYNLLEYSDNYPKRPESLWNYYRDEVNDDENENNPAGNYRINNNKTKTSKSFKSKTKLIGSTPNKNNMLNAEVVVLLKYLSNFWRSLDWSFINCEIELSLT